ncbi:MAG: M24 family metallopeptidase C-terminal domain-containing protein [Lachnospiraceae bacterium]|nr:M24 family metallopeptidase C-terminal domain-containing protein [Lachnospiraceae bacterium]
MAGSHGIRLENILLVGHRAVNGDGEFIGFEPLTWVPVDLDAIDPAYLDSREKGWLNMYHEQVREKLLPFMETIEEEEWLKKATEAI